MRMKRLLAVLVLAVAAPAARAIELADGKLSVNGDGQWAYQRTAKANTFLDASPAGNYQTAMFDLLLSARPSEDVTITALLGFDPEEVAAEWAFAEWRVADLLRLRAGKVKQPLGNYSELQFVGTARPFFTVPTTIYGPANIAADAYLGAGATGEWSSDSGWGLQYDVYGGALQLTAFDPFEALRPGADPATLVPQHEMEHLNDLVGGRISVTTPLDVVLRFSSYGGRVHQMNETEQNRFLVYGVSALYRGEKLWVSTEFFRRTESDADADLAGYAEVAWFLTPRWQLAARAERSRTTMTDKTSGVVPNGDQLLRHDEAALGLSYWVSPQLVVRGSYHEIRGNRFSIPEGGVANGLENRTRSVIAGAQFAF
jgi:hypothetical protein